MTGSDFVRPLTFAEYAVRHYGAEAQIKKTQEELRELDHALTEYRFAKSRSSVGPATADVIDEIADVLIMAIQLRVIFGGHAIDERVQFKIERQVRRMRGDG